MSKHLRNARAIRQLKEFQMEHSRSLAEMYNLLSDENEKLYKEQENLSKAKMVTHAMVLENLENRLELTALEISLSNFGEMLSVLAPTTSTIATPLTAELRRGVFGEEIPRLKSEKKDVKDLFSLMPLTRLVNSGAVFLKRIEASVLKNELRNPQTDTMDPNKVLELSHDIVSAISRNTTHSKEEMRVIENFKNTIDEYLNIINEPEVIEFLFDNNAEVGKQR